MNEASGQRSVALYLRSGGVYVIYRPCGTEIENDLCQHKVVLLSHTIYLETCSPLTRCRLSDRRTERPLFVFCYYMCVVTVFPVLQRAVMHYGTAAAKLSLEACLGAGLR